MVTASKYGEMYSIQLMSQKAHHPRDKLICVVADSRPRLVPVSKRPWVARGNMNGASSLSQILTFADAHTAAEVKYLDLPEKKMAERKAWLDEFKDRAEEWLFTFRVCLPNANSMYGFRGPGSASQHHEYRDLCDLLNRPYRCFQYGCCWESSVMRRVDSRLKPVVPEA
ncbi:uncharacterized protein BT62DRAFT_1012195 [Guyanagaster necrorhizus]|uniref:Uncharacterized protein n=1 Tax=Guyanagaster necrorhizus TaxID=856835 RepID=A0A9P7VI49_9AGAR|nr:uncharacterized protein BT62DRAFT_1012195 [Guyanagaster necrorhizus MCA 3950]KAG7440980.1 hypothetical protein BT62DRAFT_1012195 [Guyanagaster necrorhizus MCA 3950]